LKYLKYSTLDLEYIICKWKVRVQMNGKEQLNK
jgi:hypothetical protein